MYVHVHVFLKYADFTKKAKNKTKTKQTYKYQKHIR